MTVHTSALAFQSDLDRITAERPPVLLRLVTLGLALMLASIIGLASVTRVDIVVSGHGRLAADQPTNVLQPLDRAILRSLAVHAGDVVRRGQVLATLDATFARADLAALQAQREVLLAESARLQAEMDSRPFVPQAGPPAAMQAVLFEQRQREYLARLSGFDQTLAHDAAEMATARHQIVSLQHQVAVAQEVKAMREALMHRAVGSRLQYLDADSTLARAAGELAASTDRVVELDHLSLSHAADRRSFIEGWRRDVVETFNTVRNTLGQTDAALRKTARINELVQVVAPEDGTVLEVAARGPGSVLKEAEPLLTLLPAHAGLIAEITIKSADIGYIRAGDPVTVKIDAFPYQLHGALTGQVRSIAAASYEPGSTGGAPGDGTAVHRVNVTLNDTLLAALPVGTGAMPGMTVSADVRVGTRSVLAYFLAPVTRGFAQSLHEP